MPWATGVYDGIPKKFREPDFHACEACIYAKMVSHKKGYKYSLDMDKISPGSYFQIDFAFVRGPTISV